MSNEIFIQNYLNIFETSDVLNIFDSKPLKIAQSVQTPQNIKTITKKKSKHIVKAPYKKKSKTQDEIQFKQLGEGSILLIQQNLKFIKILSNIRKQLHPNVFIYIEDETTLLLTIVSSTFYPLITYKLDINGTNIQTNTHRICFQFPYPTFARFIGSIKPGINYFINLKNSNSVFVIEFSIDSKIVSTDNVLIDVEYNEIIRLAFIDKMVEFNIQPIILKEINFYQQIMESKIKTLIKVNIDGDIDFIKIKNIQQLTKKIKITEQSVQLEFYNNSNNYSNVLGEQSKGNILFNILEPMELKLSNIEMLLKSEKINNINEKIYYLITEFLNISGNIYYLLIRVISPDILEFEPNMKFKDILTDDVLYYIFECH
jgi:hypothetical protein